MRNRGDMQQVAWSAVVALLLLPIRPVDPQVARPAPCPAPISRWGVDSIPEGELVRYIGCLRFDSNPYAGDEQRLLVGRYVADSPALARYGPRATIQPEEGENRLTQRALTQGRIVARFINQEADSYPKLGILPRSVTYWWIEGPYQTGRGRSVFIATDSEGGRLRVLRRTHAGLTYDPHPEYRYAYPRAVARWYWTDRDEQGWVPCPDGCCRSGAK